MRADVDVSWMLSVGALSFHGGQCVFLPQNTGVFLSWRAVRISVFHILVAALHMQAPDSTYAAFKRCLVA